MFKNYRWNIYIINSTAMLRFKRYADKGLNIHLYIVSRETLHTAVRLVWISSTSELKEQHQPHKLLWMSAVSVLESIAMNYLRKYHQGSLSLSKHSHAISVYSAPLEWKFKRPGSFSVSLSGYTNSLFHFLFQPDPFWSFWGTQLTQLLACVPWKALQI